MTAPTHIAFGLLTVASSFSLFSMSFHRNLPAVACAIIREPASGRGFAEEFYRSG